MMAVPDNFERGLQLFRGGRLSDADRVFQDVLSASPNHARAWLLRGVIAAQTRRGEEARSFFTSCLSHEPTNVDARLHLAMLLAGEGNLAAAYQAFEELVQLDPQLAIARIQLGEIERRRTNYEAALDHYNAALTIDKRLPQAHFGIAETERARGDLNKAIESYQAALASAPDRIEIHVNLGNCLRAAGRTDEAIECLQLAVKRQPKSAETHFCLAHALSDQKRFEEAIASNLKALELKPQFVPALMNLGIVFKESGDLENAIHCLQKAISLTPKNAELHMNLGNALLAANFAGKAIESYQTAARLNPVAAEVFSNLGRAYQRQGNLDKAVSAYQDALRLRPGDAAIAADLLHQSMHCCEWTRYDELLNVVMQAAEHQSSEINPFALVTMTTSARQQFLCIKKWSERRFLSTPLNSETKASFAARARERIRIGYMSCDYRAHATSYLIAEMLERHDRERFEFFGYSIGPDRDSEVRQRVFAAFDKIHELSRASDAEVINKIADDEVDILVDLNGHTADARTQVLAARPAPIQVNYLGFPGTMGCDFMDYIVVDKFLTAVEQQPNFSERLVRLPCCYQPNDSQQSAAEEIPSRADCGLPEDALVFCSFNNNFKITPRVFDIWMRLLQTVPKSVLWLLEGNEFSAANLRNAATQRQIDVDRLVFAPRLPRPQHLARHVHADIFLDTFPCNAHTTASDALRQGIPIVTCAGETFASRVAGSLLHSVNMSDLITDSLDEYESLAVRLALSPEQIAQTKSRLKQHVADSGLFRGEVVARALEKAYARMWELYKSGQEPASIAPGPIEIA